MKSSIAKGCAAAALVVLPVFAAPGAETGQVARVNGMDVFYGVIPAEIIRGHPAGHTERKMHGGAPAQAFFQYRHPRR